MATTYYKIYIDGNYAGENGELVTRENAVTFASLEEVATFTQTYLGEEEYLVRCWVKKS
jgi:hypothetical protein